ncbi:P2X purinoceptor 4a isoform X1 [Tachysurus ichikawai]
MVFGTAGKFNIIPTLLNIGAGLALLGLVNVVCDCISLTCMTKKHYYREQKYTYVNDYEIRPLEAEAEEELLCTRIGQCSYMWA